VQLAAGSYICVECSDNGCGIQEAILPRIFEPFFTTKQGPAHRGLGLALVYGIITNHKGGVAVSSQPGNGTSVRVYLPADNKGTKSKGRATKNLSGKERILIVDDEEIMLTVEETILSAYGYKVQQANSGQKALELLEQQEMGVDLVITDLIMPGMNGVELMEHVRRVSPQTRILCTSGYTRPGQYDQAAPFLQKPFTSQDLLVKVQEVLSAEEPASG
jgi:CheY-like chemotaxis protein